MIFTSTSVPSSNVTSKPQSNLLEKSCLNHTAKADGPRLHLIQKQVTPKLSNSISGS